MRGTYRRAGSLGGLLGIAAELSAATLIIDVEPLVAYWDTGQEALERGVAAVLGAAAALPGVAVVCFSTNSARRSALPSGLPGPALPPGPSGAQGPRLVYLASARKPLALAAYAGMPRPGVVIGDQVVTDGVLAWRLGYAFLHYRPERLAVPPGPRLMGYAGQLIRPLLFHG